MNMEIGWGVFADCDEGTGETVDGDDAVGSGCGLGADEDGFEVGSELG